MSNIKESLKKFYNDQAIKFSKTRQKKRPEFEFILKLINQYIKKNDLKKINILELGCGDGRFYRFLKDKLDIQINYTGIDISENLINIAKSISDGGNFVVDDMASYLQNFNEYQKYDIVVLIASFQHIFGEKDRLQILKNIYKVLKYEGLLIQLNWSFSEWFIKKYFKSIFFGVLKSILTLGYWKWNDYFIPWKDKNKLYKRYYHIFTLNELVKLLKLSGFVIKLSGYISKSGELGYNFKDARNTIIVGEKDILKN